MNGWLWRRVLCLRDWINEREELRVDRELCELAGTEKAKSLVAQVMRENCDDLNAARYEWLNSHALNVIQAGYSAQQAMDELRREYKRIIARGRMS